MSRTTTRASPRLRIDKIKIRFLYGGEDADGWREGDTDLPWMMIEAGDFWPVMVRLERADLEAMSKLLFSSVKGRLFNSRRA